MGNGVTIMMQEVAAPIRVHGKHWGGFRSAYRL
jgi:methyl-accepting chemotaxis protein